MTGSSPASRAELRNALDTLLQTAHKNGVEVADHGYDLSHDDESLPDWDLVLTRVTNPD